MTRLLTLDLADDRGGDRLLTELVELSSRPDRAALVARIERRLDGTVLTAAQLLEVSDAERP